MIKILVVDDDKLIRWSLKEIFSLEGYKVDAVETAKDALIKVTNTPYNLIFADLEISEESGIELLKKIYKFQPKTKIIILSALAKQQIEPQLGSLSIFSIIEKPFKSEQIRAIAKKALDTTNYENESRNRKEKKQKRKSL